MLIKNKQFCQGQKELVIPCFLDCGICAHWFSKSKATLKKIKKCQKPAPVLHSSKSIKNYKLREDNTILSEAFIETNCNEENLELDDKTSNIITNSSVTSIMCSISINHVCTLSSQEQVRERSGEIHLYRILLNIYSYWLCCQRHRANSRCQDPFIT